MVFDNCQIDVFFHMRSHYKRLSNVHSVVDCSAPKGSWRLNQPNTSLQHAGMAPFCNITSGLRSHNCRYARCASAICPVPTRCLPRAKSLPPRPGTRRHPEDMPYTREMCSRSAKNATHHIPEYSKNAPVKTGRSNQTPRHRSKIKPQHHNPIASKVYYACNNTNPGCGKLEVSRSKSEQDFRSNTAPAISSELKKPSSSSEHGEPKESTKYNTPTDTTPTYKPAVVSPRDHEYLQFLLKITEDIIQNDLYTNKEMKKVFVSHFNANKDRLNSERMLLQIHQLMLELNIPLSNDKEEDTTPSWSDIETALRGLRVEKTKTKVDVGTTKSYDSKYECVSTPQERCICFDPRNLDENLTLKRKIPEEEVENINYDDYSSKNKFQTSLERLTEYTEPISSQATCKASTITSTSTFGNVDVLPGFESLEPPATVKHVTCAATEKKKFPKKTPKNKSCGRPRLGKKSKSLKRRKGTKSRRIKRPLSTIKPSTCTKCIENVCQASIVAQSRGTDPNSETCLADRFLREGTRKPLIITLEDDNENQTHRGNLSLKTPTNDYLLIKGPIYLLKAFLDENPNLVMRVEIPSVASKTVTSNLVPADSSEPEKKNANHSNMFAEPEKKKTTNHSNILVKPEKGNANRSNSFADGGESLAQEKKNTSSNVIEHIEGDSNSEKYNEIRNILIQMCSSLSLNTSNSLSDSNEFLAQTVTFGSIPSTQEDVSNASKIGLVSSTLLPHSCEMRCSHSSTCSHLCSTNLSAQSLGNSANKLLMTNDYDLTPQKDKAVGSIDMDHLLGGDYDVPAILREFSMTREIQTEDLHIEPTIVAFARIQKDKSPSKPKIYPTDPSNSSSTDEVNNILTSLGVNPGKSSNPNESTTTKRQSEMRSGSKSAKKPSRDNSRFSGRNTSRNFTPVPTAPSKKSNEIPDAVGQDLQMRLMFPYLQDPKIKAAITKADSDEAVAHTRRVSIMKSTTIQFPTEKMPVEADESKKKTETITKAVEVLKERQMPRDVYLSKAIQDIETNREHRLVEKMLQESKWTQGQHPSETDVDDLKSEAGLSLDYVYAIGTNISSIVDLPIKLEPNEPKKASVTVVEDATILNESINMKSTPSQVKRITLVSDKLEPLRSTASADDREISATLDQLVLSMKQEEETEEDIEINDEESSEQQSDTSVQKKYFRCCNFRKKKVSFPSRHIMESPQRDSFSEKQYRSKSEAFEMALLALGQASGKDAESIKDSNQHRGGELMEVASAQSIVLALTGTKLTTENFGPQTADSDDIRIDFDKIATMALHHDDDKSARFKF